MSMKLTPSDLHMQSCRMIYYQNALIHVTFLHSTNKFLVHWQTKDDSRQMIPHPLQNNNHGKLLLFGTADMI